MEVQNWQFNFWSVGIWDFRTRMGAVIAAPDLFGGKQSLSAGRLNEIATSPVLNKTELGLISAGLLAMTRIWFPLQSRLMYGV
jgi:hypothetical protein